MLTGLKCECCGSLLEADLSNNVWCTNRECILWDKCYPYEFIENRAKSKRVESFPIPLQLLFHLLTENVHREVSSNVLDILKEALKYVSLEDIKEGIMKHYGVKSVSEMKEDYEIAYITFEKYFGEVLWR